jgi:hypothetical protein
MHLLLGPHIKYRYAFHAMATQIQHQLMITHLTNYLYLVSHITSYHLTQTYEIVLLQKRTKTNKSIGILPPEERYSYVDSHVSSSYLCMHTGYSFVLSRCRCSSHRTCHECHKVLILFTKFLFLSRLFVDNELEM